VSYRHWLEHRGSEGFADLLEPTPLEGASAPSTDRGDAHPDADTTPEDMIRERPDLTTGELKLRVDE
jgi:hypothetical protein